MATYDLRNNIPSASQIAAGDILNAPYNGSTFSLTLPKGTYTLEVWGATGMPSEYSEINSAGVKGYAKGTLNLYENTAAYLLPGCGHASGTRINGGSGWGGDASDIRLLSNSLYNRIIVAGGGGGSYYSGGVLGAGGYGGGTTGGNGTGYYNPYPTVGPGGGGGTQTAGGAGGPGGVSGASQSGSFGAGGSINGGGGWYGGGGGGTYYDSISGVAMYAGGGGGSGFVLTSSSVSNVPSNYASALKNAKYYLTSTQLINGGSSSLPATPTPHQFDGDGYIRITVVTITPPVMPPSNLTYSSLTETSVKLSWTASPVSGVTYAVYRGTTSLGTTTSTTFTDTGITTNKTYTYKVYATKSGFADSSQITLSITNPPKLGTPTAKTTTYTETYTKINWNAVSNATAYKVYRGSTLLTSDLTATSYTDTSSNAIAGKSNTYKVSATARGYYESAQLSISTSNPAKLATPTGLALSYTVSSTTLTWNAVTNAKSYKVWRGSTLVASSNTSRSYTDTTGGTGKSYTYYVAAVASGYYESDQASISSSNKKQFSAPTNLSVSYTQTSTTISWSKVTSPATATVYNVWRGNTSLGTVTSSASTISYTDSSSYGASGKSNTYYVTAAGTNSYYESAKASIRTTNPATLATPTGLTATYTLDSTTISWDAVKSATSYRVYRGTSSGFTPSSSNLVSTQTGTSYVDDGAGKATSYTYKIIASNSPEYYDSTTAAITSHNPQQLNAVTNLAYSQTVSSVTLTWDEPANATQYVISRSHRAENNFVDDYTTTVSATTFTDNTTQPGTSYLFSVTARANDYWDSLSVGIGVDTYSRLRTPTLLEVKQTGDSVTLSVSGLTTVGNVVISRDGTVIATLWPGSPPQTVMTYTDTGLESQHSYVYSAYNKALRPDQYDSEPVTLWVFIGKTYTQIERQRSYLRTLKMPFFKLCRLRFLYPNGTTAFALDNNPRNRRSKAFIQEGTVNANMQNGQRLTASVTIANANQEFDFNINKIWFGQDIAIDEGLILPNGEEYWRQTGVFVIDNPQETVNPNTKTVTYNLVDKWADLDGTLDGNLEGTYEVPVNTNIYTPIAALLAEDRGNGRPVNNMNPVFTEYFNNKTQGLPDGTTASMVLSPYTLTVDGDGGTIGEVVLGLGGMVNAWVGYDNTGRLRVEPSQDDILDAQKAVLYRFNMDEVTLLGLAYTIKKEDLFNDYIVVGEQMDDYAQPGGRAENLDPRSDTNINIIGRKTKRENASGFATVTQCKDLAEWKLKRSGVLQKAVNISCSQMFHIELNSLVEIARSDKPGNPVERHLIQGYSRPLATSGEMTLAVVSVNDFPIATVSEWPPAT